MNDTAGGDLLVVGTEVAGITGVGEEREWRGAAGCGKADDTGESV